MRALACHQCGSDSVPASPPYVVWVCCWFSPLVRELSPPGTLVFPLTLKGNTFKYQFDLGHADTFKTSSWCAAKRFSREVSSSSSYSIKMVHLPFCLNSLISRYHPFTCIRKLCCFNFVYFPRQVSNLVSRLSRLFRLGVVRACVLVTSLLWWRWKWF